MLDVDRLVDGIDRLLVERRGRALRGQPEDLARRQGARQIHDGARHRVLDRRGELDHAIVDADDVIDRVVRQAGYARTGGEVIDHRLAGLEWIGHAPARDSVRGDVDGRAARVASGEGLAGADHSQDVSIRIPALVGRNQVDRGRN